MKINKKKLKKKSIFIIFTTLLLIPLISIDLTQINRDNYHIISQIRSSSYLPISKNDSHVVSANYDVDFSTPMEYTLNENDFVEERIDDDNLGSVAIGFEGEAYAQMGLPPYVDPGQASIDGTINLYDTLFYPCSEESILESIDVYIGINDDMCYGNQATQYAEFKIGNNRLEYCSQYPGISNSDLFDTAEILSSNYFSKYLKITYEFGEELSNYASFSAEGYPTFNYELWGMANAEGDNMQVGLCNLNLLITEFNVQYVIGGVSPLDPVDGLSHDIVSDTQIDLSWNAIIDPEFDHYNVYRDGIKIAESESNSYSDINLIPGNIYTYEITAVDEINYETRKSASLTVCTTDAIPMKVLGLTAMTLSDFEIDLSWTANNETDIDHYNIYRDGIMVSQSSDNLHNDNDLSIGTSYSYQVSAVDTFGQEGERSDIISATTSNAIPEIVTNLSATTISTTQIDLSWTSNNEPDFSHYNIYKDGVKIAESTTNSYSSTGLSASTAYIYRILAVDIAGQEGDLSVPVSAKTSAPQSPIPWPFPVTPALLIVMIGVFIGISVIINKKIKK